jgi:uncharacterized membrane protein HdeD (DUF308 family)
MMADSALLSRLGSDAQALCRRTWWVFLIGGIASVIFGVLAFINPGIALLVLATFFAAAVLVDGAFNIAGSIQNRDKDGWWVMLLLGIFELVVGGYALSNPPVKMMAFILLVAFEAIVLGVFTIMLGYKVRQATRREWLLYLIGALSILFGLTVIANPALGGLSIVLVIASWAIMVGTLKIFFAFKVKNLPERVGEKFAGLR